MKFFFAFLTVLLFSCNAKKETIFPEGGYDFIKPRDSDTAFPFFPVKTLMSPRDSFSCSYYYPKIFKGFNEPNLSIKPASTPVVRIIYKVSGGPAYFITLQEDKTIVKKSLTGLFNQDEKNMSEAEFTQLSYLQTTFPLTRNRQVNNNPARRKYADSMIKVYPGLTDPAYYKLLLDKFNRPSSEPFRYETRITKISANDYHAVIDRINKSGYWKMPILLPLCKTPGNDGSSFILEMNTQEKYNYVSAANCVSGYKEYGAACQQLFDLAGILKTEISISELFSDMP